MLELLTTFLVWGLHFAMGVLFRLLGRKFRAGFGLSVILGPPFALAILLAAVRV